MVWLRWLISHLMPKNFFNPLSADYVGHSAAHYWGRAKCMCKDGEWHIMCPHHGR